MRKLGILFAVAMLVLTVFGQSEDIEAIKNRLELIEEQLALVYDMLGTKPDAEELSELLLDIQGKLEELSGLLSRVDILEEYANMIYEALGAKADLEMVESLGESISEIRDMIDSISEILTGLAGQLGDLDYLLRKRIDELDKNINASVEGLKKIVSEVSSSYEAILNRVELLEEYANMVYDMLGTKVSGDELESVMMSIEERLSEAEIAILNMQSTLDTGLPAIRSIVYGLSENLQELEGRLTAYTDSLVDELKLRLEEFDSKIANFELALEDMRVTLDIHDMDILKIYETLGLMSEEIESFNEKIAQLASLNEGLELLKLKTDMHDQDIVNIYDALSAKADREQIDAIEELIEEKINSVSSVLAITSNRLELFEEYINMIYDTLGTKVDSSEFEFIVGAIGEKINSMDDALRNISEKFELLEEYANIIYDTLGTKVGSLEFESTVDELKNADKELESKIAKVQKDSADKAGAIETKLNETAATADLARTLAIVGIVVAAIAVVLPFVLGK